MKQWTSGLIIINKNVCMPNIHSEKSFFLRASATVEAAIVMPLFIYAVTAVLYMFQIIMVKQDIDVAAYNTVRTLAKYSYAYNKLVESDREVSALSAYGILLSELGADYAKEHYIVGGNAGIVLLGSELMSGSDNVSIKVSYAVKNPFDVLGIGIVTISQNYSSQGWTGDAGVAESIKNAEEERTVYITMYGEVYHTREECAYINLSVKEIRSKELSTARNLGGGKYYGCELCMDGKTYKEFPGNVFITEYGDRYHKDGECAGIKRTVIEVPLSYAKERRLCNKCNSSIKESR